MTRAPDGVSVTPAGTPVFVASGHPPVEVVVVAKVDLLVSYAVIGHSTGAQISTVPERPNPQHQHITVWKWSPTDGFFETTPGLG
jgi:hypothetical protein